MFGAFQERKQENSDIPVKEFVPDWAQDESPEDTDKCVLPVDTGHSQDIDAKSSQSFNTRSLAEERKSAKFSNTRSSFEKAQEEERENEKAEPPRRRHASVNTPWAHESVQEQIKEDIVEAVQTEPIYSSPLKENTSEWSSYSRLDQTSPVNRNRKVPTDEDKRNTVTEEDINKWSSLRREQEVEEEKVEVEKVVEKKVSTLACLFTRAITILLTCIRTMTMLLTFIRTTKVRVKMGTSAEEMFKYQNPMCLLIMNPGDSHLLVHIDDLLLIIL